MTIFVQVPMDEEYLEKNGIGVERERECDEFDEYDKKDFSIFDRVYYSYYKGRYEGGGDAICLLEDKWGALGLGHCSCYGPGEYASKEVCKYTTIEEALENSDFTKEQKEFILKDWK